MLKTKMHYVIVKLIITFSKTLLLKHCDCLLIQWCATLFGIDNLFGNSFPKIYS